MYGEVSTYGVIQETEIRVCDMHNRHVHSGAYVRNTRKKKVSIPYMADRYR
jgi:hypothetical protein